MIYDMIYLLIATVLSPGGSNTVHIYTQTIHRKIQLTTFFGRFSWDSNPDWSNYIFYISIYSDLKKVYFYYNNQELR
jgi:uncharacterized integral membrane protein